MPKIKVLPHLRICPDGSEFTAEPGQNLIQVLLEHGIAIPHACEMQCACASCHVYIKEGFASLKPAAEKEEEILDKAWGVEMDSRLSCQVIIGDKDLVVAIPG
jgi:ferredoxin, 2Fe-2S